MRPAALVSLLLGLLAMQALAHGATPGPAAEPEEVEVVDSVEEIAPAAPGRPGIRDLAGRLHPAAVHLPIGWLLLLTLWEISSAVRRRRDLDPVGAVLALSTLLVFLPAIVTGLLRAAAVHQDAARAALVAEHRNLMLAAAVVLLLATVVRLVRRRQALSGRRRVLYVGLLVVATILVAVGGDHGGRLVHGFGLLP